MRGAASARAPGGLCEHFVEFAEPAFHPVTTRRERAETLPLPPPPTLSGFTAAIERASPFEGTGTRAAFDVERPLGMSLEQIPAAPTAADEMANTGARV